MDLLISSFTRIVPVTAVILGLGWSAIMVWTLRASSRERRRFAEAAAAHETLPRTFRSISPPALSATSRAALRDVRERGIVSRSDAEIEDKARRMLEFLHYLFSKEAPQSIDRDRGNDYHLFVGDVWGNDLFTIRLDVRNDQFAVADTTVTSDTRRHLVYVGLELLIDFGQLYDAYCRGPTAKSPETWQKAVSAEFVDRAAFVRKVIAAAVDPSVSAPPAAITIPQASPPESEVRQRATTTAPAIPPTGAD